MNRYAWCVVGACGIVNWELKTENCKLDVGVRRGWCVTERSGHFPPILGSCVVDENLASWALFDTNTFLHERSSRPSAVFRPSL